MVKRLYASFQWVSAALLAFCLPFTSFPLVANLIGSDMVAPLSLLPMLALLIVWFVPYLLRSGRLPPQVTPLLAFATAAVISSAAAFFMWFPAYKGASLLRSEVEALATLVIGICFYLVITAWADRSDRLCFLLRWINWSGVVILGWSFFQALVWYRLNSFPDWMWNFQGKMSNSLLLYGPRVNGFAFEPSWLAHQLNMLYLPFWLAAAVTGFTAHRFRVWKIHFEHLLLLGGIGVLLLSISRIGLLTFLLMVACLILLLNIRLVRWLQARLSRNRPPGQADAIRRRVAAASILVLLVVYTGLLLGTAYGLSRYDQRMARIFDLSAWKEHSFLYYANQLVFAERIVFWQAGWDVFNDHPILGVGLGNAGFFFPDKMSAFSWSLMEVRTLMYQWTALPNIKSLWVRLLAETGIVGFALFLCWGYLLFLSARFLYQRRDPLQKMIGLAGIFVLIGFLVEGFSLDTFALPYDWVSFGLLTAACSLARKAFPASAPEGVTVSVEILHGGRNDE